MCQCIFAGDTIFQAMMHVEQKSEKVILPKLLNIWRLCFDARDFIFNNELFDFFNELFSKPISWV